MNRVEYPLGAKKTMLSVMKPNKHDEWARRKVRALLCWAFQALAMQAKNQGNIELAHRFIEAASGLLDKGSE